MTITEQQINYNELLQKAITEKGTISNCYKMFYNYSIGNQIIAMYQMELMGLKITPIKTFNGWKQLGRYVKKGSKAISLWMPIGAYTKKVTDEEGNETLVSVMPKGYMLKNNWFCMDQTEGKDVTVDEVVNIKFDFDKVHKNFGIEIIDFEHVNGNIQGYAKTKEKKLAINPVAEHPEMTILHEVAHIVLGHGDRDIPRDLKEVEAETVAYIIGSLTDVNDNELSNSRGYIQSWLGENKLSEATAKRIFKVADEILKVGRV